MKEPKRYYCGNGEGMFEDDKNGHWVEYSEHKAIVEALTEQLRKHAVITSVCDNCKDVTGFYLGTTCPKCNRPFRVVKQTEL